MSLKAKRYFEIAIFWWSLILLIYTTYCGILFDHKHYVEQWQLMLSGGDPWSTDNTYGPLHNLVGYAFLIHPLAPKLIMVGAMLLANFVLVRRLLRERGASPAVVPYLLAVPTNVLTLGIGLAFGLNDCFVAAFLVLAVLTRLDRRPILTGVLIGLAALTKFYPLLLVPFFALDGDRKISWSLLTSAGVVFAAGVIGAVLIWGPGLFVAMENGASRGASLMSILANLPGDGALGFVRDALIKHNAAFVVFVVISFFVYSYFSRLSWLSAVIIGYLLILISYKVGHQQFFLPWLFLVSALPLLNEKRADFLAISLLPLVMYLSFFHFAFDLGSNLMGNRAEWVERAAGLVSFPIEILSVVIGLFVVQRVGDQQAKRGI